MGPAHLRIPTPHTRQLTQLLAGENNHHMAESSFKALGLALRQVVPLVFAAGSFCFPSHIFGHEGCIKRCGRWSAVNQGIALGRLVLQARTAVLQRTFGLPQKIPIKLHFCDPALAICCGLPQGNAMLTNRIHWPGKPSTC